MRTIAAAVVGVLALVSGCSNREEKMDPVGGEAASVPIPVQPPEGQPLDAKVAEVPVEGITVRTNEPFYMAAIEADEIILHQPEADEPTPYRRAETAAEGQNGRRFAGVANDGRRIEILVTVAPCLDSMSGAPFPMSAKLWVNEVEALGCASVSG